MEKILYKIKIILTVLLLIMQMFTKFLHWLESLFIKDMTIQLGHKDLESIHIRHNIITNKWDISYVWFNY
mgnify:CR=1 FL=1